MSSGLHIVILGRSPRNADDKGWGLGQDAKVVEMALRASHAAGHVRIASIDHIDALSFCGSGRRPRVVDINIHLEVPCRAAWRWARYNVIMVNQEWWYRGAWDWVLAPPSAGGADLFLFKSAYARSLFPTIDSRRTRIVPWRCTPEINAALGSLDAAGTRNEFLYLIGASANKTLAAHSIIEAWSSEFPPLRIVSVPAVLDQLRSANPTATERGVIFQTPYDTDSERINAQMEARWHVVASAAEGYGFTFAEAAAVGALPLWTDIPVYNELYEPILKDIGKISYDASSAAAAAPIKFQDSILEKWSPSAVRAAVQSLLKLTKEEDHALRGALRHTYTTRIKDHRHTWRSLMGAIESRLRSIPTLTLPPRPVPASELPHVSLITLTHNRPRWWVNMARNILLADYPKEKLTWIIVDDSNSDGRIDGQVSRFKDTHPSLDVKYISLTRQTPIGSKRNIGCAAAPESSSIFLMMDDDDHYPKSSILARVSWMRAFSVECVYCATLPMYDCKNYISAINVPPLNLTPSERVSEASLGFTRKFWEARRFSDTTSVAEGDGFLADRIQETAEIPPEGVIVSFLHGLNFTSRRVPESTEPNGCHYGFEDEYFEYLSGLAV
jgi:hypothetical protein